MRPVTATAEEATLSDHDALMQAVRRDPTDDAAWAVLQDWLLAHDEPRGTLSTLSGADLAAALAVQVPAWFGRPCVPPGETKRWRNRRVTPLPTTGEAVRMIGDDGDVDGPAVELVFWRGHVQRLVVDTRWDGNREDWGQGWTHPLIERVLKHPAGRLVTDIELRATPYTEFHYEGMVEALAAGAPLAVRTMYAGDNDQISWSNVPHVAALWAAAPHLEHLHLEGGNIGLGEVRHARLRSLKLHTGGLPAAVVGELVAAELPALETLEVWFGDPQYGAECTLDDARRLLGLTWPSLRRIALANAEFADDLVRDLPTAAWLPQIREISLWGSALSDAGGEGLLAVADRLAHVAVIDVSAGFLTAPMVGRLRAAFGDRLRAVDLREPYDDDDPNYYVAVGE